jgi:hypothetical protein
MPVHSTQYLSDYVTYGTLHSYVPTEGSPTATHWIRSGMGIHADNGK